MNAPLDSEKPASDPIAKATSELNNLLHIIATTSSLMEQEGATPEDTEHHLNVIRTSIARAEKVAAELAINAGGAKERSAVSADFAEGAGRPPAASRVRKPAILVVDDEQMALTLVKRVLTTAGFDVTTAQSGFECLDSFRRKPHAFDLVLLDLSMPFMDGEETFNRLREIREDVAVVLCTGFIQQERLNRLMTVGLSGFLRKPIGPEEIVAFVKSTLANVRYSTGTQSTSVPMVL